MDCLLQVGDKKYYFNDYEWVEWVKAEEKFIMQMDLSEKEHCHCCEAMVKKNTFERTTGYSEDGKPVMQIDCVTLDQLDEYLAREDS